MTDPANWFERDPLWFKKAVFYEIHLRGFYDGNDDGSGDFRGLAEKLDYLQWLGVDCLWLLPCFPSPLRDGGYDIADFFGIHPDYGERRGLHLLRRPGPPARDARDRRPRHEPHVRRPSVVPGEPHRPDRPVRRLVRLGRRRHALERGAHHLPRHRAVELDVGPGARPVLLAPVLQPPARPELRQPRGAGADAERAPLLARPRARRLPARRGAVPLRARRHERREPARDARVPAAGAGRGRRALLGPRPARRGEPVAGRRRRSTSATATSATWRSTSR